MPSFKRYLMTGTAAFLSVTVLAQPGFSAQAGNDKFGQPQVVNKDKVDAPVSGNSKGASLENIAKAGAVKAAVDAERQAEKTGVGKAGDHLKGGDDKSSYQVNFDAQTQKSKDGAKVTTYSYEYKYKEQEKKEPEFRYEEYQGEKFKVYTQAYTWCTAREDVQSGLSPEIRDVRVTGPKWGFSSISTVEMCYPEDFKLGFLASKKVTSIKLVGADGKEFLLQENPLFVPKLGDPILKGGVNPVDMRTYVFENAKTLGEDGRYFINTGSNVFKIVMEGGGVENKSVEVKINILEPFDESEECRDENELGNVAGSGGPEHGKTPDNKTPDNKTPDNKTPDNKTPDNKTPDNKTPDNKTPDNKTPDNKTPDNKTPDNKTPDNKTPDNKTPDNKTPDNKTPDNKTPDNKTPDGKPKDTIPTGGSCSGGEAGTFMEDCSGGKM